MKSKITEQTFEKALSNNIGLIHLLANKLRRKCEYAGHLISREDCISHVKLAAWLAWKKQTEQSVEGKSPYSFGAYLNTFVKHIFSKYIEKELPSSIISLYGNSGPDLIGGEQSEIDSFDLQELIKSKLDELDPKEKKVLEYRYVDMMTLQETSKKLSVSIQTVANIQKSAESKLYSKLKNIFYE